MESVAEQIRPTILVVDDDPDALAADCGVLSAEYDVLTATGAEDALRKARSASPAVIVLDVMMPGGRDGFSVFRELRHHPATQKIPVIFLTSVNQVSGLSFGPREIGQHLGPEPEAFLEKPVSAEKLLGTLQKILSGRGPGAAPRPAAPA